MSGKGGIQDPDAESISEDQSPEAQRSYQEGYKQGTSDNGGSKPPPGSSQ